MQNELPGEYLSIGTLTNRAKVVPKLLWALPQPIRWDYVDCSERGILEAVLAHIGGTIVSLTTGFDPGYDAVVDTPYGRLNVEIKCSASHSGYLEVGRLDYVQSGLTATKSHIYIHLSVDKPKDEPEHSLIRKIKVRIYATWYLRELLKTHELKPCPSKGNGPGTMGFHLNSFNDQHCWVGDLSGKINKFGDVEYDLTTWTAINSRLATNFRSMIIVLLKKDDEYEYDHKDFE